MQVDAIYFWGFIILSAFIMLWAMLRYRVVARGLMLNAVGGVGVLFLVSLVSNPFSLGLSFNSLSAAFAGVYGLPGVIGLLVFKMLAR